MSERLLYPLIFSVFIYFRQREEGRERGKEEREGWRKREREGEREKHRFVVLLSAFIG